MYILEVKTGQKYKTIVGPVDPNDFKKLTKKRYFFDWKQERRKELYKLYRADNLDIVGLVSFERIPSEWRIHIRLLSVSVENKGKDKEFDRIIGNLLAFVARESLKEYGELSCVSLIPKSKLASHYIEKYGMHQTGMTLSIELPEILNLLTHYDYGK